jgi:hypothetical protein
MKFALYMSWLLLLVADFATAQTVPRFPVKVAENGRYFVDQDNKPFFYQADTGWQLFARLTLPEAREYLITRHRHGFNTIQLQISMNPDSVNRAGQKALIDYDFSKPNEPYFAHAERVIQIADSLGLLLNIAPFWTGCCREGYGVGGKHEVYAQSGPAKARQMGQYLGKRFGKYKNILWTMGGDNDPRTIRAEIVALAEGLHASAPQQLLTFHGSPPHSSTDLFQYAPWLGFSMIYTYWREKPNEWLDPQQMLHVYEAALREYNKTDRMPFVLGESQYEGDGVRYANDIGTPQQIRRQAWWTILCGGAGHAYGHDGWDFPKQWRQIINYPAGSQQLRHVRSFFEAIPWWTLIPDQKHTALVGGYGEFMKANYVSAAVSEDKTLLVAYLPQPGPVIIDMSQLKGTNFSARWYNPQTGQFNKEEKLSNQGIKRIISPPQDDWVLIVKNG